MPAGPPREWGLRVSACCLQADARAQEAGGNFPPQSHPVCPAAQNVNNRSPPRGVTAREGAQRIHVARCILSDAPQAPARTSSSSSSGSGFFSSAAAAPPPPPPPPAAAAATGAPPPPPPPTGMADIFVRPSAITSTMSRPLRLPRSASSFSESGSMPTDPRMLVMAAASGDSLPPSCARRYAATCFICWARGQAQTGEDR